MKFESIKPWAKGFVIGAIILFTSFLLGRWIAGCGEHREVKEEAVQGYSEEKQKFSIKAYNFIRKVNKQLPEEQVLRIINDTYNVAKEHDRDPYLYLAIARVESGFNPDVEGLHTEIGLWQIKVKTAQHISSGLISKKKMKEMLKRPYFNINLGAEYLEDNIEKFDNVIKGLMAYNCGSNAVKEDKVPENTYSYLAKIMIEYYELLNN